MRRWLIATGLCTLLSGACSGVGNTGNPGVMSHPNGGPVGIAQLRSDLARDTSPSVSAADQSQFARDQSAFTGALFGELSLDHPNLFFSPYSISTAFAMLYAGAAGETKTEIARALSFNLPEPALHSAFNASDLALDGRASEIEANDTGDGFELSNVNADFVEKSYEFKRAYLDLLGQQYDAGLFLTDFTHEPEPARKAINNWVSSQTRQRIEEILPPDSVDASTVFVLVNTIYFKGSWLQKFDAAQTKDAVFHAPDGDTTVPMMGKSAQLAYARGEGYQALELPYLSQSVRMLLVLPDEEMQSAVEARLEGGLFDEARAGLGSQQVNLRLPRFSFSTDLDLIPPLQALGMRRAFGAADFSGIGGGPGDIVISGVYHQAFVGVDEQGTEAAAATAVVGVRTSAGMPIALSFDRPFLFFIYDEPTGSILFAGRLSQP